MGSARSAGGRENGLREDVAVVSILRIHSQGMQGLELLQRASGYLRPSLMPTSLAQNGPHGTWPRNCPFYAPHALSWPLSARVGGGSLCGRAGKALRSTPNPLTLQIKSLKPREGGPISTSSSVADKCLPV